MNSLQLVDLLVIPCYLRDCMLHVAKIIFVSILYPDFLMLIRFCRLTLYWCRCS